MPILSPVRLPLAVWVFALLVAWALLAVVIAWLVDRLLAMSLPHLKKYYVRPALARLGPRPRPYDPLLYWASWHGLTASQMIGSHIAPTLAALHYSQLEYFVLLAAARWDLGTNFEALDLGSGAGHWLDFWQGHFTAKVYGVDISSLAVERLVARGYRAICADLADLGAVVDGPLDAISAMGVMYHLVDDDRWRRAVGQIGQVLRPGGYALISGHFGLVTRDVQFHARDSFSEWTDLPGAALVNKRVRSLAAWRRAGRAAGLRVVEVYRGVQYAGMPESNLLVLQKEQKAMATYRKSPYEKRNQQLPHCEKCQDTGLVVCPFCEGSGQDYQGNECPHCYGGETICKCQLPDGFGDATRG